MSLRTSFILSNYLLAGMGISCLILSEIFSGGTGALLLAGLTLCFFLELNKILPVEPPNRILLSKWAFLALPILYIGLDLPLVDLVTWFLVFLILTRFIFKTELNDYLFGHLLSIVCLLIGAIYVQDLMFGAVFLAFYLILCWGLIFYNMMVERTGSQCSPKDFCSAGEKESAGASLFGLSAGLMVLSLIMTAIIFISFPRLGLGFLALNTDSSPISGFTDTVQLGDVGKIKMNDAVVMRVEYKRDGLPYRPQSRVLWRGVVLDHYDGARWSSTAGVEWQMKHQRHSSLQLFYSSPPREVVEQDVYMEFFNSEVLFTHGIPLTIGGSFEELQMNQSFALKTIDPRPGPKKFNILSEIGYPDISHDLQTPFEATSPVPQKYLQLPKMSPRISELADTLTKDRNSDTVANILKYLDAGFSYTLEMEEAPGVSALEHFLFIRKKGHCEYFASAMTVLLRLAGIPARMVNGFVGTEWNDMGNYMIVRQKHAHSWVEAFIPGKGWAIYDPTPPDPAGAPGSLNNPLVRALDLLRLNWQRYVIRYSFNDQLRILNFFKAGGRSTTQKIKDWGSLSLKDIREFFRSHAALLLLAGMILLYLKMVRGFSWRSHTPLPVTLYNRMLRKLERRGIRKKPSWTHREFLSHLPGLPEEKRRAVERITAYYEKCRFGKLRPAQGEETEMQSHLRLI